ncbi:hypothetical protein M9Y10_023524 [Tritrichomonas musculus]|uniref:Small GTP-binding protein n=1 Tax=Tritrichomonas musculus TaxID=1915356 RepID=A0ABR2KX93_9EUKA
MEEKPAPIEIKIVLAGESSVGKTCVVERVLKNEFVDDQSSTLGALYSTLESEIDGKNVIYQIWDTAGQENYRGITPMYFNGSHAVLCVFSVTDRESFDAVDGWVESINQRSSKQLIIFFIGNKIDLTDERQVSKEEGIQKAKNYRAFYYEVSAKTGEGFDRLLYCIGKEFLIQKEQKQNNINANENDDRNLQKKDNSDDEDSSENHPCCLIS